MRAGKIAGMEEHTSGAREDGVRNSGIGLERPGYGLGLCSVSGTPTPYAQAATCFVPGDKTRWNLPAFYVKPWLSWEVKDMQSCSSQC